MAIQQSNRVYSLLIGGVDILDDANTETSKESVDKLALEFLPPFNIRFSVKQFRDVSKSKPQSTIEIYNLSDKTLKELEQSQKNLSINLIVGYNSAPDDTTNSSLYANSILKGSVSLVSTQKESTERITKIIASEGFSILNTISISQSVPKGKTVGDAIVALTTLLNQELLANKLNTLSVNKSNFKGENHKIVLQSGLPMRGSPSQILDRICKSYGIEYNVEGGKLHIDDSINQTRGVERDVFIFDYNSGLIDIPYFFTYEEEADLNKAINTTTASGRKKTIKKSKQKKTGVKFKALLNPFVKVGSIVQFDLLRNDNPMERPKFFMVDSITYSGEWQGSDWTIEAECTEVNIVEAL